MQELTQLLGSKNPSLCESTFAKFWFASVGAFKELQKLLILQGGSIFFSFFLAPQLLLAVLLGMLLLAVLFRRKKLLHAVK